MAMAFRRPARSRSAFPGNGGPVRRSCRNGKSQRKTVKPWSANLSAIATSSGALQLAPAPCARISPLPFGESGVCRNPFTPGLSVSSEKALDFLTIPFTRAPLRRSLNNWPLMPYRTITRCLRISGRLSFFEGENFSYASAEHRSRPQYEARRNLSLLRSGASRRPGQAHRLCE